MRSHSAAELLRLVLSCSFLAMIAAEKSYAQGELPYDPKILERNLIGLHDGRRLNIQCIGKGTPTVVFMQGGDGNILSWKMVEKPIAAMTRACFYDRAGFGYSDPPSRPVTAVSETDDLRELLKKADIGGSIVLVGHSIGGFYATMYADRFPEDVAGLVLVDTGFAGQMRDQTPGQRRIAMAESRRGEARELRCASMARAGKTSQDTSECMRFSMPTTPAETAYKSYMTTHPYWFEAEVSQSRNFFWAKDGGPSLDTQQEEAARRSFGKIPIIVLTSDKMEREPWQSDADFKKFVQSWRAGHDQLAARSTRGRSFVVLGADHYIQLTRPEVVVAAIREVIEDVRGTTTSTGPK